MTPHCSKARSTSILTLYLATALSAFVIGLLGYTASRLGLTSQHLSGLLIVAVLYLLLMADAVLHEWRDRRREKMQPEPRDASVPHPSAVRRSQLLLAPRQAG